MRRAGSIGSSPDAVHARAIPVAASRIDRQLAGRCARQGDPGCAEPYAALGDELLAHSLPRLISRLLVALAPRHRPLPRGLGAWLVRRAQRRLARRHEAARRVLQRLDDVVTRQLAISGPGE